MLRLLLVLLPVVAASLPDYYQLLGVARDASPSEIRRAYRALALEMHPDKAGSAQTDQEAALFVTMSEGYSILKDDSSRKEYDDELAYFEQFGRLRWEMRYRVYPNTNPYYVLLGVFILSLVGQWKYWVHRHYKMQEMAKLTEAYKKEVRRRRKTGEAVGDIQIEVKGAELPVWTDLWPVRLVLVPYTLYQWWQGRAERAAEAARQREEIEALRKSMTPKEWKRFLIKQWKRAH